MKLAIYVKTYTTCLNEGEQCVMCISWYKSHQPAGRVSISFLPLCSAATQVSEMLEMNKPEHFLLKTTRSAPGAGRISERELDCYSYHMQG